MTHQPLGSRYQLEERIGEGGLGIVWRGSDVMTGAAYAIKVLRPEHVQDPATVARFVRERTALLRFRHPNVVVLHDMIVEGDRLALVMDLIAGGDLSVHRRRRGGILNADEATGLMAQVCAGLAAAHAAGIVHRDLKPANILLDQGGVRLTDFGLAQVAGEPTLTTEGILLGTLPYLAPEVILGGEPTPACDIYAVGVTLHELLGGRPPFTGQAAAIMYGHLHATPARLDAVPDATWQLIAACLDKVPGRRPGAAELERALRGGAWSPASPAGREPEAAGLEPEPAGWELGLSGWELGPAGRELGPAGWEPTGWQTVAPGAWNEATMPRAPVPSALTADQTRPRGSITHKAPVEGAGSADDPTRREAGSAPVDGPVPAGRGGPGIPRRGSRFRRGAGVSGVLAALALAGVIALALTRSPDPPGASGPGVPLTVTESVTPAGHNARVAAPASEASDAPASEASAAGASAGAQPSDQPGTRSSASAGHAAASAPPRKTPVAAASGSASARPSATPSRSPSPTPSRTPSPSATPTSSAPADTAWQCGPAEPGTIHATGRVTVQTLQACIRVNNGKLELYGVLDGAIAAWDEQVVLVLEDSAQNDYGSYSSPVCTTTNCVFTMAVVPPASGEWTVLPEWERFNGIYQSAGSVAGFVDF